MRDTILTENTMTHYRLVIQLLTFFADADHPHRLSEMVASEPFCGEDSKQLHDLALSLHRVGMLWRPPHLGSTNTIYLITPLGTTLLQQLQALVEVKDGQNRSGYTRTPVL